MNLSSDRELTISKPISKNVLPAAMCQALYGALEIQKEIVSVPSELTFYLQHSLASQTKSPKGHLGSSLKLFELDLISM